MRKQCEQVCFFTRINFQVSKDRVLTLLTITFKEIIFFIQQEVIIRWTCSPSPLARPGVYVHTRTTWDFSHLESSSGSIDSPVGFKKRTGEVAYACTLLRQPAAVGLQTRKGLQQRDQVGRDSSKDRPYCSNRWNPTNPKEQRSSGSAALPPLPQLTCCKPGETDQKHLLPVPGHGARGLEAHLTPPLPRKAGRYS